MDRRRFLASGLGLGILGLATGIAPRWLARGLPSATAAGARSPTTLILSISQSGDPVNANAPGSYLGNNTHPDDPDFEGAVIELGSQTALGAAVWGTLPDALRARMSFVHHRSLAVAHSEFDRVMGLSGTITRRTGAGQETLVSAIAQENAEALGSLQDRPIPLGRETVAFDGRPLATVTPSSVVSLFANQVSVFDELQVLRERTLDQVYGDLRTNGTRSQRDFLDQVATSRERARDLGESLGALLGDFDEDRDNDGPRDQIKVAVALAALRVAPAITINIPFGRDNHVDPAFGREIDETEAGVSRIGELWQRLLSLAIEDEVTFGMLNVFGRRLDQTDGRDHNRDHNLLWMAGPHVRGGVVGGVDVSQKARGFDLETGLASDSGVAAGDTLPVAGATLMAAAGVSDARLAERMPGIPSVAAALT